MIHEASSPVPGAERNSWHYLPQMGLKMVSARLTKALIYSSGCAQWLALFSSIGMSPPTTTTTPACTKTKLTYILTAPHFTAYNLCIFRSMLEKDAKN